jgi:HSP20 family protein
MALFRKEPAAITTRLARDPFAMLRRMTTDMDRLFGEPFFGAVAWPPMPAFEPKAEFDWYPKIEVAEKDNRLLTRIDLPGMRKEDVKVEVTDGYLAISGERKREAEEKKDEYFRTEREYGSFYRAVPLPEGVKFEDVKATFADGVLEVSLPLPPAMPEAKVRKVEIAEPPKAAAKPAA